MRKYIQNFKIYYSEHQLNQTKGVHWLGEFLKIEESNMTSYLKHTVGEEHIETRHVYAKGVADIPYEGEALYDVSGDINPTLNKRSEHAQEKVVEIFQELYRDHSNEADEIPSHLNHVSCTHYESPSAAQLTALHKEWSSLTTVTHLYHMGCYAALPAVRVSKAYVADEAQRVDIVHTELCSFHLDRDNTSAEQTIMNTLFADGAIKYSVTNETYFEKKREDALEIITMKEVIVPGSDQEMSWKLGQHGFMMTLTKKVPLMLAKNIEKYMRDIFEDAGLNYDHDKDKVLFAVHPGGPKIIDLVEKMLKLTPDQVKHSKHILKTRGNMSSATIPHIWNEIVEDQSIEANTYVATVAFGPGLTMTGGILKLCRS